MIVGFLGLGRMGQHMACNLARAGFELVVWNRSQDKAQALAAELAAELGPERRIDVAKTPRAVAQAADVVVTMLADDAASEAVHMGDEGLFAGSTDSASKEKWLLEMGTMSPAHIQALVEAAPAGVSVIDAPVSGATQAAQAAQLLIMAGCSQQLAQPLAPIFDAMGKQTICLGAPGTAAVMKLAVNSLIHGLNQTLAEALALAQAAGIQPEAAFDVIEASAAAAPMISYRRALYLDEAAQDVTFTVALARKDMAVTAELAQSLGCSMPQGQVTLQQLLDAEAQGYGARDMASIVAYMREKTA